MNASDITGESILESDATARCEIGVDVTNLCAQSRRYHATEGVSTSAHLPKEIVYPRFVSPEAIDCSKMDY